MPNSNAINFMSQPQNYRQSERYLVGNSLQNVNMKALNERAKSSTYNRKPFKNMKGQLSSTSSNRGMQGFMSATALSQIPPKTNVQVLDEYFSRYDTFGQIGVIKFTAEFERLTELIKKFWKLKDTSRQEIEKVSAQFEKMLAKGESHACPEADKQSMLTRLNRYLHMMREYYDTEVRIRNVH